MYAADNRGNHKSTAKEEEFLAKALTLLVLNFFIPLYRLMHLLGYFLTHV